MDDRDPAAFRELYDAHYAAVHRHVALRIRADGVDDVVSETFLIAWRRAASVPDHTLPWLLNVATKVLANERRAGDRADALSDRVREVAVVEAPGLEPDLERSAQRRALLTALRRLGPHDRELVLLHLWDDLRPRDIAVVLGINPVAARARLSRASRRLQQALRGELAAEDHPAWTAPAPTASDRTTPKRTS